MAERILGFIGVGRMGSHMSRRLVAADHKVVVFDADPRALQRATAAGASAAHSPADVASQAEIVMVSLPTPDIVSTVALSSNGVAMGTKIKTFIDLSTTGPRVASEVAKSLAAKGIVAVDAPVSGGPSGAEKGTLAVMVSGPRSLTGELTSVLGVIGKVFWVGERPGLGRRVTVGGDHAERMSDVGGIVRFARFVEKDRDGFF